MRLSAFVSLLVVSLGVGVASQSAPDKHTIFTPSTITWGPAPPILPAGAQIAVLDGDPSKPGFFSIRLKFPNAYKIAPHWHPTDEHIVVLQGTLRLGMGEKLNAATAHDLPAGSYGKMPKEVRHYAIAKGATVVQIYGAGPFVLNYVNPADDPSKKPAGGK